MHYWEMAFRVVSPLEAASGYVRLYGGGVIPQLFEGYVSVGSRIPNQCTAHKNELAGGPLPSHS
jgi:hypothetical protein